MEANGIATVIIAVQSFERMLKAMMLPRVLITPYPMGRPLGAPHDSQKQSATIKAALELLNTANKGGTMTHFNDPYT
ncbi:MAG: hypothetical protein HOE30_24405 [Deltaproteobacteria bacterium]|nr:hypothetical protein [Deltaproteobacteria bacterium]MBT4642867.1 hypothetical protein [Deltaproteobacteria bacterium]MBT7712217.1 hypothetical protein [Deltaproteobacteria bacterium]